MSTTKQLILKTALALFNEDGISNVSLRAIAAAADISVGNLHYHFKKRERIVETIYFQLVAKFDRVFAMQKEELLRSYLNISTDLSKTLYAYRFFFLDFVPITRNNPKIKAHYAELSKRRAGAFLELTQVLVENGLFREELLKDEYRNLFKRIELISNFWFSSILIQKAALSKKAVSDYAVLLSQTMYPYLTEKAKKQYAELFPAQLP